MAKERRETRRLETVTVSHPGWPSAPTPAGRPTDRAIARIEAAARGARPVSPWVRVARGLGQAAVLLTTRRPGGRPDRADGADAGARTPRWSSESL